MNNLLTDILKTFCFFIVQAENSGKKKPKYLFNVEMAQQVVFDLGISLQHCYYLLSR